MRRAFDTGASAEELLAALREAATGGRVPQPLQYLVTDLARRHGALRVRPVACVLRSEDPTLLAELPRVKSLAKLGLTELAPTVYASALARGADPGRAAGRRLRPGRRARRRHDRLRSIKRHRVVRRE